MARARHERSGGGSPSLASGSWAAGALPGPVWPVPLFLFSVLLNPRLGETIRLPRQSDRCRIEDIRVTDLQIPQDVGHRARMIGDEVFVDNRDVPLSAIERFIVAPKILLGATSHTRGAEELA